MHEILVGIIVFIATGLIGVIGNSIWKRYLRDKAFPTRIGAVESSLGDVVQVANVLLAINVSQTESIGTILTASRATLEALQGNCNGNVTAALGEIQEANKRHGAAQEKLSEYIQDRAKIKVKA